MVHADLEYNPYLLETKVSFNGNPPRINSLIEKYQNEKLQTWVKKIPGIFYDEMNGYDFELDFSGTELDFEEVKQSFVHAGVGKDRVILFHKGELDSRQNKVRAIENLLRWLDETPNRRFDKTAFREENKELFEGAYPFVIVGGVVNDDRVFEDMDISIECVNSVSELKKTDLQSTPVLLYLDRKTVGSLQNSLKVLFNRPDVDQDQLFFLISPVLGTKMERVLVDLGVREPQIVESVDDGKIIHYLEIFPVTEFIQDSIKVFREQTEKLRTLLEDENKKSMISNRDIHEKIDDLEDILNRLKEAYSYFINKDNLNYPEELITGKMELLAAIRRWKRKVTKIINTLYERIEEDPSPYIGSRINGFKESLERFISEDINKAYHCKMILSQSSLVGAHTHERIGLALIQSTINEVLPKRITELSRSKKQSDKARRALVLYDIVVAEFVVAILTEIAPFFQSLHKIVDGPVDADRLDYVVRDSINSGVDWGIIPYKRLIQSCKLFYLNEIEIFGDSEKHFSIAYQKKSTDDIVDMLVTRYKIFARINYHHRCIKTAAALKACVIDLAIDYFQCEKCVCEDIHLLWDSLLLAKAGDIGLRIIQWNDSWLVSNLHKALVTINQREDEKYTSLKENLEEILLNRKSYYSLLKRGDDQRDFVSKIYKAMGIKPENVEKINKHEEEKLRNSTSDEQQSIESSIEVAEEDIGTDIDILFDDRGNALDALGRLDLFDEIIEDGDLSLLNTLLPLPAETMESVFKQTLDKLYDENIIKRYQIYVNKGRGKLGIPSHDTPIENIFLYSDYKYEIFNENYSLRGQLDAIQNAVPVINIYYVPSDVESTGDIGTRIIEETALELGSQHTYRLRELFGDDIL